MPAILKLLAEPLRELRIECVAELLEEHPPEYDLQSNGSAEVGVQLLKGHFRTIRSGLESQLGFRIPVWRPLISWMIRHAGNLINCCWNGHDGRTARHEVKVTVIAFCQTEFFALIIQLILEGQKLVSS